MEHRIDGHQLNGVAELLASGEHVIVQFAKPPATKGTLAELNRLAKRYGVALQIRFFGYCGSRFDFETLLQLPNMENLVADCLHEAVHFEALRELRSLRQVAIGVHNGTPDDLLTYPSLSGVERLVLGGGHYNSLDLSPVSDYRALRSLDITGYTRGIDQLAKLTDLQSLSLSSIGNRQDLGFVNKLSSLRSLRLILGGREHIDEVINPSIEEMTVVRVRGLSRLKPEQFTGLKKLSIDDQLQISSLSFSKHSRALQSLRIVNCKALESLEGLTNLGAFESLSVFGTSIDFDTLMSSGIAKSLKKFVFYSKSRRLDVEIHKRLRALGFEDTLLD